MPLPDCMMPDGAEPCKAYTQARDALRDAVDAILRSALQDLYQCLNKADPSEDMTFRDQCIRAWRVCLMIPIAEPHRRNIEQMIDELEEKRDAFLPHDPLSAAAMQKEIDALEWLLLPRVIN